MGTSSFPDLAYPDEFYPDDAARTFKPPVTHRPATVDRPEFRPFHRVLIQVGQTVLKEGAFYRTVENPMEAEVSNATVAYVGGHDYPVTDDEALALEAAGYVVMTNE